MTRQRVVRSRRYRTLMLATAISVALVEQAHAGTSPFARRGVDPAAQAAQVVQQQGLQSAMATQLSQQSLQAFQRAAQARSALDAAQAAARAAAAAAPSDVPDGLAVGGLQVASGVVVNTGAIDPSDPGLGQSNIWYGAQLPTQTTSNGQTDVTIQQTQQKAILNWQTFNVGKNTQLTFDQSAGGTNAVQWIALNRVNDPNAAPSMILGSIKAQGTVYVIDRNGVIFGGTSQVNTHSLLVSSLDLFTSNLATSNSTFVQQGLFGPAGSNGVVLTGVDEVNAGVTPGAITIQAGAQIASGDGGYALLAAPNISNAGSISAVDGQVMLAAVLGLHQGQVVQTTNTSLLPVAFDGFSVGFNTDLSGIGTLDNTGLVSSTRGDATLVGYDLIQNGIVTATTSISRPGSVSLLAIDQSASNSDGTGSMNIYYGGLLDLSSGSITTVLPDEDGETTTSSAAATAAFVGPTMNIAGAQVSFDSDSMVFAPGATLNIIGWASNPSTPPGREEFVDRIWMDPRSVIDVAGMPDVPLSMSTNLITIPRVGQNELADSPLQQDGILYKSSLVFDRRDTGTSEDGLSWVGSPLLDAQGYVDDVPRTIDQMLVNGGTVNITGHDFVMNPGSSIDIDGGYLDFLGGMVETQRLIGSDGKLYDLADADPSLTYVGFAGQQSVDHSRWGVTQTFSSPLLGTTLYYESEYLQGGNAGSLNIDLAENPLTTDTTDNLGALVLAGDLSAQAVSGRYQLLDGDPAQGGALNLDTDATNLGNFIALTTLEQRNWQISTASAQVPDGLGIDTPVLSLPEGQLPPSDPGNPGYWSVLSTDQIAKGGFSQVSIGHAGLVNSDAGSNLQVADGGTIAITAGGFDLQGAMTAHAGNINLLSLGGEVVVKVPPLQPGQLSTFADLGRGNIVLGADARLDVSGNWVNDSDLLTDQMTGMAYINGGDISLATRQVTYIGANGIGANGVSYDGTGSILLAPGSVLDASSGGYVNTQGDLAMSGGVPLGRGGNIDLETYQRPPNDLVRLPTYVVDHPELDDQTGLLDFQGAQLIDNSFAGGGTLTLRALGVQIGGTAPTDPRILYLDPSFFDTQGFGGYNLSAELDATITAGTQVRVSQLNLLPDIEALQGATTGTDIFAGLGSSSSNGSGSNGSGANGYVTIGQLDPFHRTATNFSLSAGNYLGRVTGNPTLIPATGTLLLDEGASIDLDPGADVRLGSRGQVTILGDITDHGGDIVLSGDSSQFSGLSPANPIDNRSWFAPGKSVWVGSDAVLDVSGISLIDPLAPIEATGQGLVQPRTGKVLDGGNITLTDDTGYVVVQQGAQFNLSGASDVYDLPTDTSQLSSGTSTLQPTPVWSNGGDLTLAASAGLYFDGSIHAAGGAAQASGGTLTLLPEATPSDGIYFRGVAATGIVFTQSDTRMPDGLTPGSTIEPAPSGMLYFAADLLDGSGIGTLVVGNQTPIGNGLAPPLVPIGFSGNVDLSLSCALIFNAPLYAMLPDGATNFSVLGTDNQVQLAAPYVALDGYQPYDVHVVLPKLAQPGATTLDVNADFIDIGGQFALAGVGMASFDSTGDIRFHTPAAYAFEDIDSPIARSGELLTAGNLEFQATEIYPESGETFAVLALGALVPGTTTRADTSITVNGNGASSLPLSAGGTLAMDATNITQDGTIRAPSGSIVLGVSDTTDAATEALFNGSPLIATQNVVLGAGSLTSVSLDGAVLPYGTTVDGTEWQYNADPYGNNPDLTAAPQKRIELGGANVSLDAGATVDLSGGGDVQAVEWIPGTGGSRDVLSQYNTNYASGSTAQQVPLYPDGRGVYAILPGAQSPVAASDPVFEQSASSATVGESVYLSGVPGLAPGVYTLLPAMYATLPGAYRVVVQSGTQDATPAQNFIQPDGTAVVSGYYVNALTGARDARTSLFDVQSRSVWGQYSDYTTTSGNAFFANLAASEGDAVPQRGVDAGQLVLAATQQLGLGATLETSAGTGGTGAEIDIASKDIQVLDGDHPALDGYVQLNVSDLDSLDAGSLLIGGIRQQTAQGTQIDVLADSVVVSNDAANPLYAPEILMVAGAGQGSSGGLQIGSGSVIEAKGDISASSAEPILIGTAPNASGQGGVSGDGALLRVSNAGDVQLIRNDVPDFADAQGNLVVGDGAQLIGGASLMLDSTGNTQVPADAVLQGTSITADAGNIRFVSGAADPGGDGLVIGDTSLANFASADNITLRSYGTIDFIGNIDLQVKDALTLSAGTFTSDGGTVNLGADTLTLSNDLGAANAAGSTSGSGTLNLSGQDVVFGDGNKTLSGFGSVSVDASDAVAVQGKGDFDFGSLDVSLTAPAIEAYSGAENTLQTTGSLALVSGAGTAAPTSALGGSITLQGGSIDSDALILAASGSVDLHATSGDVDLHDGAQIDVAGVAKTFFDTTAYSQGGDITLQSDQGNVNFDAGTSLDFSAQAGGGDAGSLTVSAQNGSANLLGTFDGTAAKGVGGSFALDVGSAVDLDTLSQSLASSGIDDAISVHSRSGNLTLSAGNTLTADSVTLIADGGAGSQQRDPDNGNILVAGTIDASGDAGGDISLWGRNGVEVDGSLLAKGSDPNQLGGNVVIGTNGNTDGTLNTQYGYENVQGSDAGVITLGNGAVIDVSGGSADGLSGGTVDFRAPLLTNGDVNVTVDGGATIAGARDVDLEAYAVWSTADASTDPSRHFDGIIDPSGWYNANGQLVAGTWTDRNGVVQPAPTTPAQVANYLAKYIFTPNAIDNAHSQFYGYANASTHAPGTLMGFVQDPGFAFASRFADIANFHAQAGIELRNPDASVNGGAISVLTGWDLASGTSPNALDFRYQGEAPVLTLRAVGDIDIDASISDGFFQTKNPFSSTPINTPALQDGLTDPLPLATDILLSGDSSSYRFVAGSDFSSTAPDAVIDGGQGDVVLDGHFDYQQSKKKDVLQPTTLRTGTGSIEIAASRDLLFADPLSPASIYTAGTPAAGTGYDTNVSILRGGGTNPDVIVGAQANSEGAGDITLTAGRDIIGNQEVFDPDGSISKVVDNYIAQYWWPWMQLGDTLSPDGQSVLAAPIDFGGFAQGVLSTGGDVSVQAGRNISELSVSLPVSWTLDATGNKVLYGGGNLDVSAGGDVLGGDYFVAQGTGTLTAGGDIGSAFTLNARGSDASGVERSVSSPVDPIIALEDGQWTIQARGDAAIGAIVNPTYQVDSEQTGFALVARATVDYSTDSSVAVSSLYGDVDLNTLALPGELFDYGERNASRQIALSDLGFDDVLPASLSAVAFGGDLSVERSGRMFPSADGELSLLADDSIDLYDDTVVQGNNQENALQMLDAPGQYQGDDSQAMPDQELNLHRDDDQPVYVYALNGDIVGGFALDGFMVNPLTLILPKPAEIRAGRDIVNLDLRGQNFYASDITSVIAGRDLYYTQIAGFPYDPEFATRWTWLELGGPGTFVVQAGRNLGPLTSANEALDQAQGAEIDTDGGGIRTVGNNDDTGLPAEGATIDIRYGVAPGVALDAFAALYIDPSGADTTATYSDWLTAFVLQFENDQRARGGQTAIASLSTADAWTFFQQMPDANRQLLVDQVFMDVLEQTGADAVDPSSPDFGKYAPGYQAVQALFPSSLGYTANNLEGGSNGAATQVSTGEFDMRGSTVQTEAGGDIRILGPGGNLLVGSISAPPTVVDSLGNTLIGPDQQGILAIGLGDIGIFSDASVLLAQSRIFTERGGDVTIWSSNGDINAGKGVKTSSEVPPVEYLCDQDHYCFVDARGQVSGAGIATLQTMPGDSDGNAVLVAPRGTVDAGDAGIRVAGNLVVASEFVANADNIDVKGSSVGVSGAHGIDAGTLNAASSAASAVADAASNLAAQQPAPMHDLPSIISVQVIGFGGCGPNDQRCKNAP